MYVLILRTALIYVCVLVAMRLMGKRQLGELQPAELVSTMLISNLASISIESADTPLWNSLLPLFLITVIEIVDSLLVLKFPRYARLVLGSPKILIRDGEIDQTALHELRLRVEDLLEALRGQQIYDVREVCYAVAEPNGTIHAAKYPAKATPTRAELSLPAAAQTPVLPFWLDGQAQPQNLSCCGKTEVWLQRQMRLHRKDPAHLLAVLGDDSGICLWIQKKEHPAGCPQKEKP